MLHPDCRIVHIVHTIISNKQKLFPTYMFLLKSPNLCGLTLVVSVCCHNLASHVLSFYMLNSRINIFSRDKNIKWFYNHITVKNEVSKMKTSKF